MDIVKIDEAHVHDGVASHIAQRQYVSKDDIDDWDFIGEVCCEDGESDDSFINRCVSAADNSMLTLPSYVVSSRDYKMGVARALLIIRKQRLTAKAMTVSPPIGQYLRDELMLDLEEADGLEGQFYGIDIYISKHLPQGLSLIWSELAIFWWSELVDDVYGFKWKLSSEGTSVMIDFNFKEE